MLGCLKAFAKTTLNKRFYDLERAQVKGLRTEFDLGFDETRILSQDELANLKEERPELMADTSFGTEEEGYSREHSEHDFVELGLDEETIKDRQKSSDELRNC
jgi:anaerobic magnesium-protoporphyrin IX monomethyl ester cyclase